MPHKARTRNNAKLTKQRFPRSEAHLQAAINLLGVFLYTWDPETGALEWDAGLKAVWGLPPDAHVDHDKWMSGIHPADRARVEDAVKRCRDPDGDGVYHIEYRVIGIGDGVERWVSTHGRMRFRNERPLSFTGAACEITERKRIETALRDSEVRLAATLEQLPIAVGLVDRNGVIILANRALDGYALGRIPSRDSAVGTRWRAYGQNGKAVEPSDFPGARALRGEMAVPGTDFVFVNSEGRERWTRVSAAPFTNSTHEIVGAIVAIQDVDAEKRAEECFREFAANSTDVLWVADTNGRVEYLSPAFDVVFGSGRDSCVANSVEWTEMIHPDHRKLFLDAFEKARDGRVAVEEFRAFRADGAVRWIRNTFFPIRDDQGRFRRIGGIAQDITRDEGSFIYLIDPEDRSRVDLSQMLREARYDIRAFRTSEAFLEIAPALRPGCILINIERLGSSARELPWELGLRDAGFSVIALGGPSADIGLAVQLMKAGAVDFVEFPRPHAQVRAAIANALAGLHTKREQSRKADRARGRLAELTEREREVLAGLLAGKTNKEIGRDIGISPRTVESHRAHVMQRLGVQTLPEAVLMAAAAGFQLPARKGPTAETV